MVVNDAMPSKAKRSSARARQREGPPRRGDMERHADRTEAHPGEQPLVEAHALPHQVHGVDGLAVEQAEVAGAFRQAVPLALEGE